MCKQRSMYMMSIKEDETERTKEDVLERKDTQREMKRGKKYSQYHARYDYHTRIHFACNGIIGTHTQCVFLAHLKIFESTPPAKPIKLCAACEHHK